MIGTVARPLDDVIGARLQRVADDSTVAAALRRYAFGLIVELTAVVRESGAAELSVRVRQSAVPRGDSRALVRFADRAIRVARARYVAVLKTAAPSSQEAESPHGDSRANRRRRAKRVTKRRSQHTETRRHA